MRVTRLPLLQRVSRAQHSLDSHVCSSVGLSVCPPVRHTLVLYQLLQRRKSVLNAAARLIFSSSRFDHISPRLSRLHWLKASERISYKVTVLVYKCQHGQRTCVTNYVDLQTLRRRLSTVGDRALFSCRSRSSVKQSSIAHHCCPLSLHLLLSS